MLVRYTGRGSMDRVGEMLAVLGMQKPLLVCGDRLAEVFCARTGLELPRFSGYHPNPDFADCAAGAALYRSEGCDGLISLGGGSCMDTAKGIKAMLLSDSAAGSLAYRFSNERIAHIAIPATAGTGAEATQFAVVYLEKKKHSLSHIALLPEGVILDASLLDTLPDYHRRSCALDALCQGIESWWAAGATEESRVHAAEAIRGGLRHLRAYLAGDKQAAEGMMEAAFRSGEAIQISRTTAAHAMSYRLCQVYGIAHGHACALTLPILWELLLEDPFLAPVMARLTAAMGLKEPGEGPVIWRGLLADTGMLLPAQPNEAVLEDLSASVNAERLGNHPQRLTQGQLKEVYRLALQPLSAEEEQRCIAAWRAYEQR